MLLRCLAVSFLAVSLNIPTAASGKDLQLGPSSKWRLNYDRDSCTLARNFGENDTATQIRLVKYSPHPQININIIGVAIGDWLDLSEVEVLFGTSGEFVRKSASFALASNAPDEKAFALLTDGRLDNRTVGGKGSKRTPNEEDATSDTIDPQIESSVTSMSVRSRKGTITLILGSMRAPMEAMHKCTNDLVSAWGLDPVVQSNLATPLVPRNPETWLSYIDYPSDILRKSEQANVTARLMVDHAGKPTQCVVQGALGNDRLALLTCETLMKRARFKPAKNHQGISVPSYFITSTRWVVPRLRTH